jgi:hypothetical protein
VDEVVVVLSVSDSSGRDSREDAELSRSYVALSGDDIGSGSGDLFGSADIVSSPIMK